MYDAILLAFLLVLPLLLRLPLLLLIDILLMQPLRVYGLSGRIRHESLSCSPIRKALKQSPENHRDSHGQYGGIT